MRISNTLKRELLAFGLSIAGLLATRQLTDLDAIAMTLQKLLDLVNAEIKRNEKDVQSFGVESVDDGFETIHTALLDVLE